MNNNKENYKKAVDQIHASDELKDKAFEKAKKNSSITVFKVLSMCAVLLVVFLVGTRYVNEQPLKLPVGEKPSEVATVPGGLKRFASLDELEAKVTEAQSTYRNDIAFNDEIIFDAMGTESVTQESAVVKSESVSDLAQSKNTASDFSTTNTQVENVDEADIVKTDGKYIYYVSNGEVYIVGADNLELTSKITFDSSEDNFNVNEIYNKDDKIIVMGNAYIKQEPLITEDDDGQTKRQSVIQRGTPVVKARVYDISNKQEPELVREVALEGRYINSRMIDNELYFISRKSIYFNELEPIATILPVVKDSTISEELITIDYTEIAYFDTIEDNSFMMVGGFDINDNDKLSVETIYGAGNEVYSTKDHLYIAQSLYFSNNATKIYKFELNDTKVSLIAEGEIEGYINDQFSMDEYNGNLRVATTVREMETNDNVLVDAVFETNTKNNLYVLNEKLEKVGELTDLAKGEKIYSVRFIGDMGYVVTFKEIDPLFVIDLSNPIRPEVKGELKIPGYSSYLHPYDENHIIGIGYNTKDNGYGGVTNSNMKMSMFDISDMENPKEIFNVDIGDEYAESEVTYNHKALFYKESEDLIGFPVTYRNNNFRNYENGFVIFKIDIENNEFEKYAEVLQKLDYKKQVDRIIYIDENIYTLAKSIIAKYDLNTLEKIAELDLKTEEPITEDLFIEEY